MTTISPQITDPDQELDEPIFAHIIDRGDDERPAWAIILEASVNGTPITAICGYIWVPSRDPEKHPLCPKCEEMFPFVQDANS